MSTAPVEPAVDRAAIADEMDDALARLHVLLADAGPADLRRRSDGTAWSNEQLLFHMVFGYLVVRTLLPLVRLMGRLPAPVGRGWAALLNSATRPFHVVNYWGSVGGARVFDRARMGRLADRTIAALQRSLAREPEAALHRGMPFPSGWDPYFGYLTLAEVYRYATRHFEHHRRQLTLPGRDDRGPRPPRTHPRPELLLGPVLAILTGARGGGPHACAGEFFGNRRQLAVGVLADLGQHGERLI
jgi:hypothetical protein